MSTAKAVAVQGSAGEAAFKRVKPLLDDLKANLRKVAAAVATEYETLPKLEKEVFATRCRERYGWGKRALLEYAQIGREFSDKSKLISCAGAHAKVDETSKKVMLEIAKTDGELLQRAAKKGMFDVPVTEHDIRHLRKTGAIPEDKPKQKPTPLEIIRSQFKQAEKDLNNAGGHLSRAFDVIEEHNITSITGPEVRALHKQFEILCATIATMHPDLVKNAIKVLRGEA